MVKSKKFIENKFERPHEYSINPKYEKEGLI